MATLQRKLNLWMIIFMSAAMLTFIGCSDDDDDGNPVNPGGNSTTQTIFPASGGSVTHGNANVNIPPNALTDTTDVTVAILTNPPGYTLPANTSQIGSVYQFTPDDQTFNLPVMVTFTYTDAQLGNLNENTVTIYTYESAGATPTALTGIVRDAAGNSVRGTTTHFSYFYIGATPQQGGSYPPPSGGNPQGDWTLDHIDYDMTTPLPDTIQFEISGDGNGTLHVGATDWNTATGMDVSMSLAIQYFGQWFTVMDTTIHDTTNASGTYTTQSSTLNLTFTASTTDPELVGTTESTPYTAETNRLILYYSEAEQGYAFDMWVVYVR